MAALQYSALDADNSEIRLLDIAPGDGDDEICCSLSVVSLNSHPQFEALSYVWGDPSIKKDVTVDGASHPVSLNLESALRDLRYTSRIRTIWVDAICIHQVDLIEKNHQIPLMSDIYRKASGVVAYLGHSNPCLELFIGWSQVWSRKWPLLTSWRWMKMELRSWIPQKGVRKRNVLKLQAFLGFLEFVCHPYFNRMWTFQEYLLPSRRPTFVIGTKPFQMGHTASDTLRNLLLRYCSTKLKAMERLSRASEREAQELILLCYTRFTQSMMDGMGEQVYAVGDLLAGQSRLNIMTLFLTTSPRSCSDPRDKIFAIHPFLQEMIPGICAPDYTKSPDDVIFETLSKIHERFPQFIWRFMEIWPLRASSMEDALGPSWLSDITATGFQHTKNAEPGSSTLRISQDFLILTLGSRFIGKRHPSPIELGNEPEETIRRIAGLMYSSGEDLHSFAGSEIRVRRKETLSERIFFALQKWFRVWQQQSPEKVQVLFSTFSTIARYKDIGKLDDIPFTAVQRWAFHHEFKFAAKYFTNKSFFWTDTGLFGTCSDRLREGDTIVLSTEFCRPCAVRTHPDPSGESNHYHMVDWVFVDGLEGATMDAQLMSEVEETPLSDIYIH